MRMICAIKTVNGWSSGDNDVYSLLKINKTKILLRDEESVD
jgi:hypothetical protein